MRILLHENARKELVQTSKYYTKKVSGLGKQFVEAVEASFDLIIRHPLAASDVGMGLRGRVVHGFPFTVIYEVHVASIIFVVAIAHHAREQGYWQDRLDKD